MTSRTRFRTSCWPRRLGPVSWTIGCPSRHRNSGCTPATCTARGIDRTWQPEAIAESTTSSNWLSLKYPHTTTTSAPVAARKEESWPSCPSARIDSGSAVSKNPTARYSPPALNNGVSIARDTSLSGPTNIVLARPRVRPRVMLTTRSNRRRSATRASHTADTAGAYPQSATMKPRLKATVHNGRATPNTLAVKSCPKSRRRRFPAL